MDHHLWRVAPGNAQLSKNAGLGHLSEVTGGVRIAGMLPESFDYDIEMNKQAGSLGHDSIDAWAGHWNVGHTFEAAASKPRVFGEYNNASGNKNPNSATWRTPRMFSNDLQKMSAVTAGYILICQAGSYVGAPVCQ